MTARTPAPGASVGPTEPSQRIEAIDMIRGFALFGVLLVNMYNFGAYSPTWTDAADRAAFGVMRFFFETKSWRLFALLFGLGFSLQLSSRQARGVPFVSTYLRRLVVLFVIGMGHALLFPGDVLMVYAELGVVLLVLRNAPSRLLVVAALALLALYPVGRASYVLASGDVTEATQAVDLVRAQALNDDLLRTHPVAIGSLEDVVRTNAQLIPPYPFGPPLGLETGLGFLSMFLLGLYLGRRRVFADLDAHIPFARRVAVWGLAFGVVATAVERAASTALGTGSLNGVGAAAALSLVKGAAFTFGSTALCLAYAALVVVLSRTERFRTILDPLGAVGRLALTVYLTQTLVFTTLFYGYGLGLAFRVGPAAVTGLALLIFAFQVAGCRWWVRRFRFGPIEWLWRALTYMQVPPMRTAKH